MNFMSPPSKGNTCALADIWTNSKEAGLSTRDSVRNVCELSLSMNPVALPEEEYSFILQPG